MLTSPSLKCSPKPHPSSPLESAEMGYGLPISLFPDPPSSSSPPCLAEVHPPSMALHSSLRIGPSCTGASPWPICVLGDLTGPHRGGSLLSLPAALGRLHNPPLRPKASPPLRSPYFGVMVPNFFSMRNFCLVCSLTTSLGSECRERGEVMGTPGGEGVEGTLCVKEVSNRANKRSPRMPSKKPLLQAQSVWQSCLLDSGLTNRHSFWLQGLVQK